MFAKLVKNVHFGVNQKTYIRDLISGTHIEIENVSDIFSIQLTQKMYVCTFFFAHVSGNPNFEKRTFFWAGAGAREMYVF